MHFDVPAISLFFCMFASPQQEWLRAYGSCADTQTAQSINIPERYSPYPLEKIGVDEVLVCYSIILNISKRDMLYLPRDYTCPAPIIA
jgi:hypothetical protein